MTQEELTQKLQQSADVHMTRGDLQAARHDFEQATSLSPDRIDIWMSLAACCRRIGDLNAAMDAVDGALRIHPKSFLPLLMRGSLYERNGQMKEAAEAYRVALIQIPDSLDDLSEAVQIATRHAQDVHKAYTRELQSHIEGGLSPMMGKCTPVERGHIGDFVQSALGRRRAYHQAPTHFFHPGLPSIEFYDRAEFPWLKDLEASTDAILGELHTVISEQDDKDFVPYVDYHETTPLGRARSLNRSPSWSAFHIIKNGAVVTANAARLPHTMEVLSRMPLPHVAGRSPAAMFSVLKAGARIPPHTGVSNTRLVAHLPLIVPPDCRFRVGNETRTWRKGEAWVFDDTIEHEAFNDSDQDRTILIFDIWQPALSENARTAITKVFNTIDSFEPQAHPALASASR